jgi:hypothetical protein
MKGLRRIYSPVLRERDENRRRPTVSGSGGYDLFFAACS